MWIIFLIFIILCSIFLFFNNNAIKTNNTEHFQWDPLWVGKTSLDCYNEKPKDCLSYSNCGLCWKNGIKKCIPGDTQGPFFKERCHAWEHTNYYDRHIFGEKVTTVKPSWDQFNPGYEVMYPSPVSRSALQ
jgi:hypothetical protein